MESTSMVVKKRPSSKSHKSGLVMPVGRINRLVKKKLPSMRVGASAPVYLAAVMEAVAKDIIDLASNVASSSKPARKRISPADISAAVRGDPELSRLFSNCAVCSGDKLDSSVVRAALNPPLPKAIAA